MSEHDHSTGGGATAGTGAREQEFFLLRWIDRLTEAAGQISGICVLLATVIVCYAVAVRATGHSAIWQTELAVYLLVFVTFVGGAYGLKHGSHVSVELFAHRLSVRGQLILQVVRGALSLVLIGVVAWFAILTWWDATARGATSGTAWDVPLTLVYAILPLGMLLIALQYLAIIARAVSKLSRPSGDSAEPHPSGDGAEKGRLP